jgi:hypothetical protein
MIPLVEGGGRIQEETFSAFLVRRGSAFQDGILGAGRARLFRDGQLTTHDLLEAATGRPLLLDELMELRTGTG